MRRCVSSRACGTLGAASIVGLSLACQTT